MQIPSPRSSTGVNGEEADAVHPPLDAEYCASAMAPLGITKTCPRVPRVARSPMALHDVSPR